MDDTNESLIFYIYISIYLSEDKCLLYLLLIPLLDSTHLEKIITMYPDEYSIIHRNVVNIKFYSFIVNCLWIIH